MAIYKPPTIESLSVDVAKLMAELKDLQAKYDRDIARYHQTLVDTFAGLALQGMMANTAAWELPNDKLAGLAYATADAMMEARFKR